MVKVLLVLTVLIIAPSMAHGHEDRILELQADGSIPDIPQEFGIAKLLVEGLGTPEAAVKLRIGKHETTVSRCLVELIRAEELDEIELTASWWHEEELLPFYLSVTFYDPGRDPEKYFSSGYSFLFNLHNAELLEVNRLESNWFGDGGRYLAIDLDRACD